MVFAQAMMKVSAKLTSIIGGDLGSGTEISGQEFFIKITELIEMSQNSIISTKITAFAFTLVTSKVRE